MASVSATSLAYEALRLLGVLRAGMGPNPDQLNDALDGLNDVIETWNIEKLTVYDTPVVSFALTPGQQTYTWGPGANFNAARPVRIEWANLLYTTGGETLHLPIQLLDQRQWASVRLQTVNSPIPTQAYIDDAFPSRNVSFLPYPSASCSVEFYVWQTLSAFADLTTTYSLPPAYKRALKYALAVEMAPAFAIAQKHPPLYERIEKTADMTKAAIQNLNLPNPVMVCDPAILGPQLDVPNYPNILTGWY
jgi:hypothetical protein